MSTDSDSEASVPCVCDCGQTFDSPAEAAKHHFHECDGSLITDDEKARQLTTMTDEISVHDYAQIGSHQYSANVETDDGDTTVTANLFSGSVEAIGPNDDLTDEQTQQLLSILVSEVPATFENPVVTIRNDHQISGGGGVANGQGGGGGSGGDDSFDGDIVSDPDEDTLDGDVELLEEKVGQWLSNYASVKSSMIDGAWDLEVATITNPDDGSSEQGVYIDVAPWYAGSDVWDNSDRAFKDDDAKESFGDHREAMRGIFSDDDSPVKGVVDDSGEYNEWYNYVPVEDVEDL